MIIDGFEELTLLDYPGHLACIIFTRGCNYRCSYCQNSSLMNNNKSPGKYSEDYILDYLKKRKNKIEGIVISGGEPTIQLGLKEFIKKVKDEGFKVKLDTNGSNPKILKELLDEKLLDYVAMDIKCDLDNYEIVTKCKVNTKLIKESIDLLIKSKIDYEFRTTLIKEYVSLESIDKIIKLIPKEKYYLQNFRLSEDVIDKKLHGYTEEELKCLKNKYENTSNIIMRDL